jgi:prevent-host-death family protein
MKPTLIAAEPVSAYDAKTNLSRLLERTAQGQRFVITRHGKPVAQLIPFVEGDEAAMRLALDKVASIRTKLALQGVTLSQVLGEGESTRELIHAGHRY